VDKFLLFGGSFDPIHHGHLIVARYVAEFLGARRVILVPAASPPHKAPGLLAPASDRLAMCRLAVTGDPQFEVSDWETKEPGGRGAVEVSTAQGQPGAPTCAAEQPRPNYTIYTVRHFREVLGVGANLYWLIGMDSLHELGSWHRAAELVDDCTIVTAARPGCEPPDGAMLARCFSPSQVEKLLGHIVDNPRIDIAGTDIRARVRAGRSIRYLVPDAVRSYIAARGLYQ